MDERDHAIILANGILERPSGDPDDDLAVLSRQLLRTREALDYVNRCLDESVQLQSHYATLLNAHDGGTRMTFKSGDAWMIRLRALSGVHT